MEEPTSPRGKNDMIDKIPGSVMTSDTTIHTARAWPVPGEVTTWSVTWLPGRALTEQQAMVAMAIAEEVARHAGRLADNGDWQLGIDVWAAELGITGPIAIAQASKPAPARPGHNRAGEACAPWCVTDHDEPVIPGKPEFGYMDAHFSDPVREVPFGAAAVKVRQPTAGMPVVHVQSDYGREHLDFGAKEARVLAAILRDPANDVLALAGELEAAASLISGMSLRGAL
jgi:hypothetical protein